MNTERPTMSLFRDNGITYIHAGDLAGLMEICAQEMTAGGEVEAAFVLRAVGNFAHATNDASAGIKATALDFDTISAGLNVIRSRREEDR